MKGAFIGVFVLAVVGVIFALQNPGLINVRFGPWEGDTSMALTILLTFAVGMIVGALAMVPARMRRRKQIRQLRKTVNDLATSIEDKHGAEVESTQAAEHPAGSS